MFLNEEARNIRDRIIEMNSDNQTLIGMHSTVKRLLTVMYYNEAPMTLDDMTQMLGMSKASMSNAVRELDEIGLVEKVWIKGERKDIYQVEKDNYDSFFKYFAYHWRKLLMSNTVAVNKTIEELNQLLKAEGLDEETSELIHKDLTKLNDGLEYFDWLGRLVHSFETKEIFNFIPKSESVKIPE